jgi:acylphosphatase
VNPDSSEMVGARIHVQGRVQGVGFRAFVQQVGSQLGLTGWVRNVGYDGVEVLAEGPRPKIDEFIQQLKLGPRASHVENTQVAWEKPSGNFKGFSVKYSI